MKRAIGSLGDLLAYVRRLRPAGLHPAPHMATGRHGERQAARYLRRAGYRLLGRNLKSRFGEIDLLATAPDGRTVVFVEVKSRRIAEGEVADQTLPPEVHVNEAKRRKIAALAAVELRRRRLTRRPVRFDIIGVDLPKRGEPAIRHHVGAFSSPF